MEGPSLYGGGEGLSKLLLDVEREFLREGKGETRTACGRSKRKLFKAEAAVDANVKVCAWRSPGHRSAACSAVE